MAKDPICGMEVDEKTAKFKLDYMGKIYYFCNQACKTTFEKNPAKYVSEQSGHSTSSCCCC
ncbi:MAG: YHS domain-containing protein [Candidatus Bathyarchaeota archaeon]|nr:YHS domain-containing protein [Candidatus Bathyarchaeota archaeon]MDH5788032.1 YHS domain-containing protein [Candidatus Bathyarchaeota archaeon]